MDYKILGSMTAVAAIAFILVPGTAQAQVFMIQNVGDEPRICGGEDTFTAACISSGGPASNLQNQGNEPRICGGEDTFTSNCIFASGNTPAQ